MSKKSLILFIKRKEDELDESVAFSCLEHNFSDGVVALQRSQSVDQPLILSLGRET